jgi:inorganic pyrophosphatase
VGALRLLDDGEQDDKMLAVRPGAPLGDVHGLDELRDRYPGVLDILETWFVHYKGPGNRSRGFVDAAAARSIVAEAARPASSSGR